MTRLEPLLWLLPSGTFWVVGHVEVMLMAGLGGHYAHKKKRNQGLETLSRGTVIASRGIPGARDVFESRAPPSLSRFGWWDMLR